MGLNYIVVSDGITRTGTPLLLLLDMDSVLSKSWTILLQPQFLAARSATERIVVIA